MFSSWCLGYIFYYTSHQYYRLSKMCCPILFIATWYQEMDWFCRWPYRDCDYCFGRWEACACEHETKITWSLFILIKEDIFLIFCSFFFLSPCMQNKAVNTTERWKCYNKTFSYLIILNILLIIFLHIDRKDVSLIFIIFYLNYLWNIFLNPSK